MATSSNIFCGICEGQHLTKCADHWCPECDEGLCNDCEKYHRLSKATRNHALMSIDDYNKLPADISKIRYHCEDHGKKFQNFCPLHEQLCCPTCISVNHKNCSGLLDLDDVVKTSKTSSFIENLELSIMELGNHIEMIIKDRQQNLTQIEDQRRRFEEEIKQMREKINCLLDKLETSLIKDLDQAESKITLQVQSLLSKLKEHNKAVGSLQNSIVTIKTHSTDLQTFIGCKSLSEQVSREGKYIKSLSENGSLQQINLVCEISEKVSEILTTVTDFGYISERYNPPSVLLKREKDKQAQIMTHVEIQPTKSIDQVILKLSKKLKIPKGNCAIRLTGVDMSPDGKVIIVDSDNNKRLIILNQDGSVNRIIPFSPDQPYDVVCLDESMIAVSIFNKNITKLVDIVSGTVSRTIVTDKCDGITQRQGKLIYCGRERGIILHDFNGNTTTTLVKNGITRLNYVTTFKDNIYHTNCDTDTVSCYKTNGQKVWDYNNTSILRSPHGVTIDNHSNVYVASALTNSVVIISSDGKQARQIQKSEDGIRTIQFDEDRTVLIVVCYDGDVKMYNVLYIRK